MNQEQQDQFRQWLIDALDQRDMTQKDLAERIEVSVYTVSAWVNGRFTPMKSNLEKMKQVFREIPIDDADIEYIRQPVVNKLRCDGCEHYDECMDRVMTGWPLMCENLTRKEIRGTLKAGQLQELIWWRKIDVEMSVEELMQTLTVDSRCPV